ncbi:bifunctional glycosyltransferase/class I SAM-dependent methyltransferase [Paraburkholderia sp. ZP32-5]|uniref:bifunctional glycosyltransferase/class I SAM-dependent methyltransferase n=1 Tax=Paraburkholderia sp. ZP32-5 TaxID=2883245 RepID=UPI001F31999C|nr:bifunctional glycosyltransferase/class I SAM-dependent methyltransferase [Paraburkholderia sp. ZP32-5]
MPNNVPIVTVSYNTPDLVCNLVRSIRAFYPANPIHIVDGSDSAQVDALREGLQGIPGVELHAHGFNIHHGPGIAWALQNLPLGERCLFLDSDVTLLKPGMLEDLLAKLQPGMYGVGCVMSVRPDGINVREGEPADPSLLYLHPACMLCHPAVMLQWPLPFKHGAPMLAAMQAIHDAGKSAELLGDVRWVEHDFANPVEPVFISHPWQGTVQRSGSYNLDSPDRDIRKSGQYDTTGIPFNADLLNVIQPETQRVIEVGCNVGGLAAALKRRNAQCHVVGIEIREEAARSAMQHCDAVYALDVEAIPETAFQQFSDRQCWVFGDVLEHLTDPWKVLKRIRAVLPPGGSVAVCLPNMQHWSVQARLAIGALRYEEGGLLDRTHLRWFTRQTILEMFDGCGYRLVAGHPRIFDEPQRAAALPWIKGLAQALGVDPEQAEADALPMQYVMRFEAA